MNSEDTSMVLIGVGGAGCRMAATALAHFGPGMRAVGFDSDALDARRIEGFRCSIIGASRLDGRGTGGDIVNGRLAVQDDAPRVREAFAGARTAVVVCGLGGGFGGGATPEILRLARESGLATLCFATMPFAFEGRERKASAERARALLEENSDALCAIPFDELYRDADPSGESSIIETCGRAASTLCDAISLFWRLTLTPGFVRFDPDDLGTLLRNGGGRFHFGVSEASGSDDRAEAAVKALVTARSMREGASLASSHAVVLGILGGTDLRLNELSIATNGVTAACPPGCPIRTGTVLDSRFDGTIRLVALAFENWRAESAPPADDSAAPEQSRGRKPRSRPAQRSKIGLGPVGRGRFRQTSPTMRDGENLDEPTYLRRGITLPR